MWKYDVFDEFPTVKMINIIGKMSFSMIFIVFYVTYDPKRSKTHLKWSKMIQNDPNSGKHFKHQRTFSVNEFCRFFVRNFWSNTLRTFFAQKLITFPHLSMIKCVFGAPQYGENKSIFEQKLSAKCPIRNFWAKIDQIDWKRFFDA